MTYNEDFIIVTETIGNVSFLMLCMRAIRSVTFSELLTKQTIGKKLLCTKNTHLSYFST
jgi:hypothetical protein